MSDGPEDPEEAGRTPEVPTGGPSSSVEAVEPSDGDDNDEAKKEKEIRRQTVLESHGYSLGGTIGSGSFATVKIAKSDRHECQVAVKIVSKFQAPEDYLKKFLPREIQVAKGLKHPHLIRFLQAIETTHRVYIIMEFAHNGSLLDIICRDVFIDEPRSRLWFRQLTDAVDYCHERGVVHRDIKCENLLMDQQNNIKLSDFGFARGHMRPKNGAYQLSDTFCGSYAYASPEILRGIPYQPQLSDVWSLGVVLYAMVYGCLPFDDSNYAQLLKQVQSKVTFPKVPKISNACRSLITRILTPQRFRPRLANIRSDTWLVGPSTSEKSLENVARATSTSTEMKGNAQMLASPPLLAGRAPSNQQKNVRTHRTSGLPEAEALEKKSAHENSTVGVNVEEDRDDEKPENT